MPGIDINRTTTNVQLPRELADEIWAETQQGSAVMQFAQQVRLPGSGVTIQTITGEPTAQWVAETAEKPVSRHTLGVKNMTGYKLAVIEPFSDEFRRDKAALYRALAARLPNALAREFDRTVFHATAAPGSNFDLLSPAQTQVVDTTATYDDIVAVDGKVAAANGVLSGWVLSPKARGVLLSAKDSSNRPLLLNDIQRESGVNSLLGVPVTMNKSVYKADAAGDQGEVLGFAGDWSSAMYGVVQGVSVSVTDTATINDGGTLLHLWQRNMFALRAEIEVGFIVRDIAHFVKVLSGVNTVT